MSLLVTKIITLLLLGVSSALAGFLPIKIKKILKERKWKTRTSDRITSCLLCFGAGVLMATVFVHMLPEIREMFTLARNEGYISHGGGHTHLGPEYFIEGQRHADHDHEHLAVNNRNNIHGDHSAIHNSHEHADGAHSDHDVAGNSDHVHDISNLNDHMHEATKNDYSEHEHDAFKDHDHHGHNITENGHSNRIHNATNHIHSEHAHGVRDHDHSGNVHDAFNDHNLSDHTGNAADHEHAHDAIVDHTYEANEHDHSDHADNTSDRFNSDHDNEAVDLNHSDHDHASHSSDMHDHSSDHSHDIVAFGQDEPNHSLNYHRNNTNLDHLAFNHNESLSDHAHSQSGNRPEHNHFNDNKSGITAPSADHNRQLGEISGTLMELSSSLQTDLANTENVQEGKITVKETFGFLTDHNHLDVSTNAKSSNQLHNHQAEDNAHDIPHADDLGAINVDITFNGSAGVDSATNHSLWERDSSIAGISVDFEALPSNLDSLSSDSQSLHSIALDATSHSQDHNGTLKQPANDEEPHDFPLAELVLCLGFFLIYFIEEIVQKAVSSWSRKTVRPKDEEMGREDPKRLSTSTLNGSILNGVSSSKATDTLAVERRKMSTISSSTNSSSPSGTPEKRVTSPNGVHNPAFVADDEDAQEAAHMPKNFGCSSHINSTPSRQEASHAHSHIIPLPETKGLASKLRSFLVVFALSFHAVFEGLAVGLQERVEDVWFLFLAVASHKIVLSFCVGMQLLAGNTPHSIIVIYIIIFAVVTPLGICLGILATGGNLMVVTICQGLAGGTILYVIFFEVLERERQKPHDRLWKLLAIFIGFAFMSLMEFAIAHDHGEHGHSH